MGGLIAQFTWRCWGISSTVYLEVLGVKGTVYVLVLLRDIETST